MCFACRPRYYIFYTNLSAPINELFEISVDYEKNWPIIKVYYFIRLYV